MADWNKKYPVNYNIGGDDVYTGFVKVDNELTEIYSKLNILRTIQATNVLPTNPKLNEVVLDLNDLKLKIWNGTTWVNLLELQDGSVTSAKIADGSVTSAKIANGSVTSAKIADGSVTSAKIANKAITLDKLAAGLVVPDADKVDGYHASQTPQPNTIPVAGSDGKLNAGWLSAVGGTRMKIFTSSGTWDVPSGVSKIYVLAVGGGGGGGGAYASSSSGYNAVASGGGGLVGNVAIVECLVTEGETLTIVIGSGGAGGSNQPTGGGAGGDTYIRNSSNTILVLATGGQGGGAASAVGNNVFSYGSGVAGSLFFETYADNAGAVGGHGMSCLGRGGLGGVVNQSGSSYGSNASGFGCGGGGGAASSKGSVVSARGGDGSSGLIIIWY